MYLIAKNKIANYIQQHPEAATAFLTWLKEHPDQEAKSIAHMLERPHMEQQFTMMAGVGRDDYQIESRTNYPLKTTCIVWVGSGEELEAREEAKADKRKAENPGLQSEERVKIVEVVLVPPPPIPFNEISSGKTVQPVVARQPELIVEVPYTETHNDFKTVAEYEGALTRATAIFEAQPGSPEFDELAKLIPLIAHYEQSKLALPELKIPDVVKYKMEMFEMVPEQLTPMIGTTEEIDLFLTGKRSLPEEKLKRLCDFLWIKFRV